MKKRKITHIYKHVQVISNDIHDKQTADQQTTCSEPTNWLGFEWMNEWMDGWVNFFSDHVGCNMNEII